MAATAVIRNVFVYGTLLAPEVVTALLHRVPRASLAVLHDYIVASHLPAQCLAIGIASSTASILVYYLRIRGKVFGKVLFDLSDQERDLLDEFENFEYTKFTVSPLILKAHDVDGELVTKEGAQEGKTLNLPNGYTENGALEEKTVVEISPGHHVGLRQATEVTADIYLWVNEGDPALGGVWDYERQKPLC